MITTCRALTLVLVLSGSAAAQSAAPQAVPAAALEAEAAGQWAEALEIYQGVLARDPARADIWLRVADVHAVRKDVPACLEALRQAAALRPGDARVQARLAQCYSILNRPGEAAAVLDAALALQPDDADLRFARAQVAAWLGDYRRALSDYGRLRPEGPRRTAILLNIARVAGWAGATDRAAGAYRDYVTEHPDDPAAPLEWARVETWRGNYAGAAEVLRAYRTRFGDNPGFREQVADLLARTGRGAEARAIVSPLLRDNPDDYQLRLINTLALVGENRPRAARDSLARLRELRPRSPETRDAERVVLSAFGGVVHPGVTFYSDSDRLHVLRSSQQFEIPLVPETRLQVRFDGAGLRANRPDLAAVNGDTTRRYASLSVGFTQAVTPRVAVGGRIGSALAGSHWMTPYAASFTVRPIDTLDLQLVHGLEFFVVSPRTVDLGITDRSDALHLAWTPGLVTRVDARAAYHALSDGSHRWEMTLTPLWAALRRSRVNLDIGVSTSQLGTDRQTGVGYYNPARYESYSVIVAPYLKTSADTGVSLWLSLGAQRERGGRFRPGGTAAIETSIGIRGPWALIVNGSATINERLASGAFRGASGQVGIRRRF